MVDEALTATKTTQSRLRDLPSRVVVYLLLAACLFPEVGYLGVWHKLTAGLAGIPTATPSAGGLGQARHRIGAAPLRWLFDLLGGPAATPGQRGTWCPLCNLHLRSITQRHNEILAAGIREVVVFHSPADELLAYQADLPFAVIADPDKRLYREFGVEAAPRALLHPRVWRPMLRAAIRRPALTKPHDGVLGLPADFLIATDNRVLARKYGTHAYDQWTVDELLHHAR
jgi:hypothetical protein